MIDHQVSIVETVCIVPSTGIPPLPIFHENHETAIAQAGFARCIQFRLAGKTPAFPACQRALCRPHTGTG
jgi:hypothetical protein